MAYTPMNYQSYGGYNQPYQYPTALPQLPQQMQTAPQQMQQPVQPTGFGVRAVTSREEALGVQVDFFSPGTVMPDLGHGAIYLKRFNQNTGASDLYEFRIVEPQEQPDELQQLREAVRRLEREVAALKQPEVSVDE